jgi:acetolactate synthase-1/2/3 large subunit
MADKPAATLLHLGPGMANGLANLHNARRAASPVINLVGDHATYHLHYDAPLTSDALGVAAPMSDWVRKSRSQRDLAQAGAEAFSVAQTYPGKVATVIVPADHAWDEGSAAVAPPALPAAPKVPASKLSLLRQRAEIRRRGPKCAVSRRTRIARRRVTCQAGRIAAATGARLICETFAARHQRGEGRVAVEKPALFR